MKILKYFSMMFIMLIMGISMVSCDKDEEVSNPLVGTWEEIFEYEDESTITTTTFTFNSDGTGVKTVRVDVPGSPGLTQDPLGFSYTYNEETEVFRIKYDKDGTLYTGTASLTGKTLVLRYGDTYYSLKKK